MNGVTHGHQASERGVRLSELLASLSLAVDLGLGQPMGHVARSCVVARRLAARSGLPEQQHSVLFHVTLLGWVGCIADSHEAAAWFGDDIIYRGGVYDLDMRPLPFLGYLLRHVDGETAAIRVGRRTALVATGARGVQDSLRAHCQVTAQVARRLGLDAGVQDALLQVFARWDGKGLPKGVGGSDVALPIRMWQLADVAEVHHRRGGVDAAVAVAMARRGTAFDPELVDTLCVRPHELFEGLDDDFGWEALAATEPSPAAPLTEDQLDRALEAMADWVDLKSPWFGGHSRAVADLAAAAATHMGMEDDEVRTVRRAGLVHALGRTGVPNSIWDKPTALTATEGERLRMHSYYTERMLTGPAALAAIGQVAACVNERLDGSGYHRGLTAVSLSQSARVLAAAAAFRRKVETRPHRDALTPQQAARFLTEEVAAGRLDHQAVDAVLAIARMPRPATPMAPAGLTPREVEVLALLARGPTNRQIAARLSISPKTVSNHVERIYAKTGVTTRAAASFFAMEHGLAIPPDLG